MTESSRNFIVGLTAIGGLIGLCGLVLLFGYVPAFLEDSYTVTVRLPNAGGLNRSNRVVLSGLDIGRINRVDFGGDEYNGVVVQAEIRRDVRIPVAAKALVVSQLFSGAATLTFDTTGLTPEQRAEVLPDDGSALMDGTVTTFTTALGATLAEPIENLTRITVSFEQLSRQWEEVGAGISDLVKARDPAAVDRGEGPANLATVLQRADQDLAELKTTLARINGVLGDEKLIGDVKSAAANAAALTGRLVHVADQLSVAIAATTGAIEQARTGEGTVGRLMNDPALYNNLNDAAQRLSAALAEANALLTKLKNEGLPLRFD